MRPKVVGEVVIFPVKLAPFPNANTGVEAPLPAIFKLPEPTTLVLPFKVTVPAELLILIVPIAFVGPMVPATVVVPAKIKVSPVLPAPPFPLSTETPPVAPILVPL